MTKYAILKQVADVLDSRAETYGSATEFFAAAAARWSAILGHQISPQQVALCMIELKMARLAHNPNHRDSLIDVIGYAALLADLQDAESQP